MEKVTKKTLLHGWHVAHGANMADFGGYEMPLWYPSGVKNEHLAVLTRAGIFDTSHMAVVMVEGEGSFELLQYCFTKDLGSCVGKEKRPLEAGRCVYGAFLDPRGETIDDAIVYMLAQESYMVVVNSGMGENIARHLEQHRENRQIEIKDLSDRLGKMDIQGPLSAKILWKVLFEPENVFEKMGYFSFKGHFDSASSLAGAVRIKEGGFPVLLSRTGYTGEFGFEIFVSSSHFVRVWEMVLDAGRDEGVIPCGLGARDSLRAGAMLPLSHQDIGHWPFINNPWQFALPFNSDLSGFTKSFIGSKALLNIADPEFTYAFAGNDLRKVSTEDPALVLDLEGNEIGSVLTCVSDMGIGRYEGRILSVASPGRPKDFEAKGLSCGFIKVKKRLAAGDEVELKDRRRKIKVEIVQDIRPDRTARRPIREMI